MSSGWGDMVPSGSVCARLFQTAGPVRRGCVVGAPLSPVLAASVVCQPRCHASRCVCSTRLRCLPEFIVVTRIRGSSMTLPRIGPARFTDGCFGWSHGKR